MRRTPFTVLAPLVAVGLSAAASSPARAQTAGINMGAPVYDGVIATDAVTAMIGTGAGHVRVNFRLDKWKSPGDQTKVNGTTFFEAYDGIIDAITSQGIEVYGLLNDELVSVGEPGRRPSTRPTRPRGPPRPPPLRRDLGARFVARFVRSSPSDRKMMHPRAQAGRHRT